MARRAKTIGIVKLGFAVRSTLSSKQLFIMHALMDNMPLNLRCPEGVKDVVGSDLTWLCLGYDSASANLTVLSALAWLAQKLPQTSSWSANLAIPTNFTL